MSSSNKTGSSLLPRSVFDIQFGSMPILRPRAKSVSVTSAIDADYNPQQPRRGSLSRTPDFTPVSSFSALPPSEALIHRRIHLLIDYQDSQCIKIIKQEINPDSGELYGDDVTPPAQERGIIPILSREQQRHNVGERQCQRMLHQGANLSEAGGLMRNRLIRRTNLRLAEHNARTDEAAAITACEEQAQAEIVNAASGNLFDEQKAQPEVQAHIQRRVEAKEGRRQQKLQEQRAGLAEQAALLNTESLSGLGLQLNPDFIAASGAEEHDVDDATIAELETMETIDLDLDSIPTLTLPPSTFTSTNTDSSPPRPRTPFGNRPPRPISPVFPTASLTLASPRASYQSPPEGPVSRAQEFLTRASTGPTTRERSAAEGLKDAMGAGG